MAETVTAARVGTDRDRPIRVAHVTTIDATLRFLLLKQLVALRDEGYEVSTISAPGPWVGDLEREGIRHIPWPSATRAWDPAADVRAYRELWAILRRERFDLVHTHNPKPGVIGRIAARRAGIPCVVNTVHGLYATREDAASRRLPVLAAERLAARFSDLELYQSEEDLAWAREIGLLRPAQGILLGNGVDLERFDPTTVTDERRADLRRAVGLPEDGLVVGTVGRLVAEKGYGELVQAAGMVRARRPDVSFLAIGPGDPSKSDAFVPLDRGDVVFAGWRDDVRDLMGIMDVFILPSWREGVPRSAIEAAAMSLPLVVSDIRGCREVVRDGREGFLIPPRDHGALADRILRLADDAALRARFGRAARERARERFDERRVSESVVRAYRQVLERNGLIRETVHVEGVGDLEVRAAVAGDAPVLARYHAQHRSAFLPALGVGFLTRFYLAQIRDLEAVVVVAEQDGRVVGFCTGVLSMGRFMRRFIARHGVQAAVAAGARLLDPQVLRRMVETLRYPAKLEGLPQAELVFAAVDPKSRARHLGGDLTQRVVDELVAQGADAIRVFVAEDNEASKRLIARLGFEPHADLVVHDGVPSRVYVMRANDPAASR